MAEETPTTQISPEDIQGVADKLEKFVAELPEQEQNVLGWILTRAQAAGEADTSGYYFGDLQTAQLAGFRTPIASQLARSAGLGRAAGTTEVTWGFKFGRELGGFQGHVLPG
jgi:hypothetical protein